MIAYLALALCTQLREPALELAADEPDRIAIRRAGEPEARITFHAPADARPYLHPIVAPDGRGVLTEFSPGHHKHQTGLYVGFLKVNGRDYFHNRGADHFRRGSVTKPVIDRNRATWTATYDWLDAEGRALIRETQRWQLTDQGTRYRLDLGWSALAAQDVTFDRYDYGGLFLRMPWRADSGGRAVDSEGRADAAAEGQRARWVAVGMPIEGRTDWGQVAILDRVTNPGHPTPWRVDGQLGVGPARSRSGRWHLKKDEQTRMDYRLLIGTGEPDPRQIEAEWSRFSAETDDQAP